MRVGDLCLITGGFDTMKSTLALELAWSLACRRPWLHTFKVHRGMRVGLLQVEIDPGSFDERLLRFTPLENMLTASNLGWTFDRMEELREVVGDLSLDCLVLDPLGPMWPTFALNGEPFSENLKTHVSPLMRNLKSLGVGLILVHHDPKVQAGFQGRASGSSALLNDPDVRIFVDRKGDDIKITVRNRLQRPTRPFTATFNEESGRIVTKQDSERSNEVEDKQETAPPARRLPSHRFSQGSRVGKAAMRRNS